MSMPYLGKNENNIPTLYVDEKPFMILGGELHNSSASSLDYMEEKVWPYIRELGLNTVLLPVAWETLEPIEGKYDFSLVKGLLEQAKREQMKLIFLWFGLWKNGESFYAPEWVKRDTKRFFRAEYENGAVSDTISPFCREAVEKDRLAFVQLMSYLKEYDTNHTVIMVQVENEIGFLKADRDYSEAAQEQFEKEVPEVLRKLYHISGNWDKAFESDAPEYFMAYHYARAVEKIASAGKEIYSVPMYVNAWLEQHPDIPGVYPSGGPVAKLIPLWKAVAPSIDMVSPDIYLPEFEKVCKDYAVEGNPLFIPEAARSSAAASNVLYVFGGMNALGFSPFGIEDLLRSDIQTMDEQQLKELNIEAESFYDRRTAPYLKKSYRMLKGMMPKLISCRGTDRMCAFIRKNPYDKGCILSGDNFEIQLDYINGKFDSPKSAGIIFWEEDGFYIAGCNVKFHLLRKKGSKEHIGIPRYEEGKFQDGIWKRGRILNGDEIYQMEFGDMPESRRVHIQLISDNRRK